MAWGIRFWAEGFNLGVWGSGIGIFWVKLWWLRLEVSGFRAMTTAGMLGASK